MQYYDLKYHKALNRSHILPNILNGAKSGIYSQFIADIVVSVLLYQNQIHSTEFFYPLSFASNARLSTFPFFVSGNSSI